MFTIPILAIDPGLGRFDKNALPVETRMELLISKFENKEMIYGHDGDLTDLKKWNGVRYKNPEDDDISCIMWSTHRLAGELDFQWLPETATIFNVFSNKLKGTIDLSLLGESALERLVLGSNAFVGALELRYLPKKLYYLDIAKNLFEGTFDLENLPESLTHIYAYENKFSGSLCLSHLPNRLETLSISNNCFTGSVSFKSLPESLSGVFFSDNRLSGSLDLRSLSSSMATINLMKNNFSGEVLLDLNSDNKVRIILQDNPLLEGDICLQRVNSERISTDGTNIRITKH